MSKKMLTILKVIGIVFIILGVKSLAINIMLIIGFGISKYILQIILNISFVVLGIFFLVTKDISFLKKFINILILVHGLSFGYTGILQVISGNSLKTQEDTMLPGLNTIGGLLSMINGFINIFLAIVFLIFGVLAIKKSKAIFPTSLVCSILLLGLYILFKVKFNVGLISLNLILIFISVAIITKMDKKSINS